VNRRSLGIIALAASCVTACGSAGGGMRPASTSGDSLPLVHDTRASAASMRDGTRLRVVSWNIKAARASSLDAIARRLLELEPDVVALQEVDQNVDRTGKVDQPAMLADRLDAEYAFAATMPYQDGYYGIATLSRYPFATVDRIALSNKDAGEPRTALDTSFCAGAICVRLINHHADIVSSAGQRGVLEILDSVREDIGSGVIVAGDFNQTPAEAGPRSYVHAGFDDLLAMTEDAAKPSDRVDFIFADDALADCSTRAEVVGLSESDHDALLADFDLSRCKP
jgi:endonuclease/exonuclease/phosphatase family metal-dependent hydrolase